MIERKNNIGKWKESLRRRAEMAFSNGDKRDDVVIDMLIEGQSKRLEGRMNEKAR